MFIVVTSVAFTVECSRQLRVVNCITNTGYVPYTTGYVCLCRSPEKLYIVNMVREAFLMKKQECILSAGPMVYSNSSPLMQTKVIFAQLEV